MKNPDFISIGDAANFLKISRPTLNKYRKQFELKEISFGKTIFLSKLELIEKIIYPQSNVTMQNFTFSALTKNQNLNQLFLCDDIIDLRGHIELDSFAIISLLCFLKEKIKFDYKNIYLLIENSNFCQYLAKLGFFDELEKSNPTKVFYKKNVIDHTNNQSTNSVILPLHSLGYKGAEKKVVSELFKPLMNQGFSEDFCGYLGWIIGELADNALTHSESSHCYLMIESKINSNIPQKFLYITIGDIGIGIQNSLRKNSKYSHLNELNAFIGAFKTNATSWDDSAKRGKGLNDILTIAIGNKSWMRCESGKQSLFFNFATNNNQLELVDNLSDTIGTKIGLILIDSQFSDVSRHEVDQFLQNHLR